MTQIADIMHPEYEASATDWAKWRLAYEGGRLFIDQYLRQLSLREDPLDFNDRKLMTYCPAFAKAAINDIKNAIFQRTSDISREGGPETYVDAVNSLNGGVDLHGASMNSFVGCEILPELLSMGKVGVFIDMPSDTGITLNDRIGKRPYVYTYRAEDIRSWGYNQLGEIDRLLLRELIHMYDEETQLPTECVVRYRLIYVEGQQVVVKFFNEDSEQIDVNGNESSIEYRINLKKIPFTLLKLPSSLMVDVADYQVALLNLASSDISYALKSNYPFYTEQYDFRTEQNFFRPSGEEQIDADGVTANPDAAKTKEIKTGTTHGRRYPKDMERPGFINPSSEPLKVSMEKQHIMQQEIRLLVNLAVTGMSPKTMASAESKAMDNEGLESGLSFIGLVLEAGERQIAEFWSAYEGSKDIATVNYPKNYSLRSEHDRREESDHLEELSSKIPSDTFKRKVAKRIALLTVGPYCSIDEIGKINKEIETAETTTTDPKEIIADLDAGLVSTETASKARGYKEGEVEKAKKDQAERLARIAESQGGMDGGAARGIKDTQVSQPTGVQEKIDKPGRGENKL